MRMMMMMMMGVDDGKGRLFVGGALDEVPPLAENAAGASFCCNLE